MVNPRLWLEIDAIRLRKTVEELETWPSDDLRRERTGFVGWPEARAIVQERHPELFRALAVA